jgi:hypothetical protein
LQIKRKKKKINYTGGVVSGYFVSSTLISRAYPRGAWSAFPLAIVPRCTFLIGGEMTRFNKCAVNQHLKFDTTNYEGEKAHSLNPEMELYSLVCTCALQNQFYRSENETLERLKELITIVEPGYTKKLAIYAREKMYLRSIPLVIAVLLAKNGHCDKKFIERIIQRADEITELLAVWDCLSDNKKLKLPAQMKKGIAASFKKFDAYQFAKYKREDKEITLRDAMFICHPKPEDKEREQLYKMIAEKELPAPHTWEVELSAAADKGKTKREVWEKLINSGKLGYMAAIRNIRNILSENVSQDHVLNLASFISNEIQVSKSKQLPFRFLSAYREIESVDHPDVYIFLNALEIAIMCSADNIPGFNGQTLLIASDVSGSMTQTISERSKVELYDVGLILAMMLQSKTRCYTGIFGNTYEGVQLPKDNIIRNAAKLRQIGNSVGYSTNGFKVIKWLNDNKKQVDRVMIFTDCQLWDSDRSNSYIANEWIKYKATNPKAKLYLFDLAGYGNTPLKINENDVYLIAGWSDKIFDVLAALDKGENVIEFIKNQE